MIVNVQLCDGKTLFQFPSLLELRRCIEGEPADDLLPVAGAYMRSPMTGGKWSLVELPWIRRNSISFVVNAEDLPLKQSVEADLPARALLERDRPRTLTEAAA